MIARLGLYIQVSEGTCAWLSMTTPPVGSVAQSDTGTRGVFWIPEAPDGADVLRHRQTVDERLIPLIDVR